MNDLAASSDAPWWLDHAACPACMSSLLPEPGFLSCAGCKQRYPVQQGVPVFSHTPRAPVYENKAASPDKWSRMRIQSRDWLAEEIRGLPTGAVVLDLGCGPGQFHDLFHDHRLIGLDAAAYSAVGVVSDLDERLPFKSEGLDVVLLSHVLEHVYKPELLLREIWRVLKPQGHLLMVTPFLIKLHQEPHDYLRYSEHWYRRLLPEVGFTAIQVKAIGNLFDHFDLVNWARAQHLRAAATGLRYHAVRRLIQVQNALQRILNVVTRHLVGSPSVDALGYPTAYGVTARRSAP